MFSVFIFRIVISHFYIFYKSILPCLIICLCFHTLRSYSSSDEEEEEVSKKKKKHKSHKKKGKKEKREKEKKHKKKQKKKDTESSSSDSSTESSNTDWSWISSLIWTSYRTTQSQQSKKKKLSGKYCEPIKYLMPEPFVHNPVTYTSDWWFFLWCFCILYINEMKTTQNPFGRILLPSLCFYNASLKLLEIWQFIQQ